MTNTLQLQLSKRAGRGDVLIRSMLKNPSLTKHIQSSPTGPGRWAPRFSSMPTSEIANAAKTKLPAAVNPVGHQNRLYLAQAIKGFRAKRPAQPAQATKPVKPITPPASPSTAP